MVLLEFWHLCHLEQYRDSITASAADLAGVHKLMCTTIQRRSLFSWSCVFPAADVSDSVTRYCILADLSESCKWLKQEHQQSATCPISMNRSGNIAAHPSAITSLISHLFLVILFFSFLALLSLSFLSSGACLPPGWWFWVCRALSLSWNHNISKTFQGMWRRSPVCLEVTRFTVFPQNKQNGFFFLSQQTETTQCWLGTW